MENPEEVLHSLEEFSKMRPKDIPRELEEYLCFVAKTGDPVYQWSSIKSLFREKLVNVITEFYESCPSIDIPPCPNVDVFNYESMKNFILEKLDTFSAAPFTVQRICELLTSPRKEYNRIDKYMRALEKNILVVSTTEPGNRRNAENGDGIVNGLENEHLPETSSNSSGGDINVEEMDDSPAWPRATVTESPSEMNLNQQLNPTTVQETFISESRVSDGACSSSADTVITCRNTEEPYVSIEPVPSNSCHQTPIESEVSVTITAIPPDVPHNKKETEEPELEPVVSSENADQSASEKKEPDDVDNDAVSESSNNEATQLNVESESPKAEPSEVSDTSEAEKSADSTSQPQPTEAVNQEPSLKTTDEVEVQDNVESTSTEETTFPTSDESTPKEDDDEVPTPAEITATAEATPAPTTDSETEPVVESNESVASTPVIEEPPPEIPKHESESEESSKDSEVSSSSSSVNSNEETNLNDDLQRQAGDADIRPSNEKIAGDSIQDSKEAEPEDKQLDVMQVDEAGDAKIVKQEETTNEAETATTEVPMEVETSDNVAPENTPESNSAVAE